MTKKTTKIPTIQELYELSVKIGIKNDPREKSIIDKKFKQAKESFEKCKTQFEKDCFDQDTLWNPYEDSKMMSVDFKKKVKKIAFGVDIETPELLLIKKLNDEGANIDLVLAHHPEDKGLLGLGDVMYVQVDVYANEGIPVNIAEKLMNPRIGEIKEAVHSVNFNRATRAAELLGLNFGNIHTPCDNCVYTYLKKIFEKKNDLIVGDIVKELQKIPEYIEASKLGNPPSIIVGNEKSRAGKIVVTGFTGGTSGTHKMYEKMAQAGIGTELVMHIPKDHKKQAEKYGINIINCGHMASDSLGINLLLDEFEKLGVEILPLSGFIRYSRNNKKFIK